MTVSFRDNLRARLLASLNDQLLSHNFQVLWRTESGMYQIFKIIGQTQHTNITEIVLDDEGRPIFQSIEDCINVIEPFIDQNQPLNPRMQELAKISMPIGEDYEK